MYVFGVMSLDVSGIPLANLGSKPKVVLNSRINIPGPSKGCQMDGSRGAIKQPLRVQTPPLGRCW